MHVDFVKFQHILFQNPLVEAPLNVSITPMGHQSYHTPTHNVQGKHSDKTCNIFGTIFGNIF